MTHGAKRNNINSSVPTLLTVVCNPLNRDQSRLLRPFTPFKLPLCLLIYFTSLSEAGEPQNKYLERLARFVFTIPDRGEGGRGRQGRNWLSLEVVVVMR